MSLVKIQGNASGTGEFTIAAPNSNTNQTLTLPDATGTFITTAGGAAISGTTGSFSSDLSFNSGYGSAAVAYGCRAWVNFNGTGTPAIREDGNVSSITDNNTGDYTVNLTTAMPDANYAVSLSSGGTSGAWTRRLYDDGTARTTSLFRVLVGNSSFDGQDQAQVNIAIFR